MTQKPNSLVLSQPLSINRESYEPAYSQLANILRHSISTGIIRPGDQLPSEAQLCERYEVSPMTVRRAINILIDQGIVIARQGLGTFVKPLEMASATFQLGDLQNLFKDTEGTSVRILESRIVTADARVARRLNIPVGQRTIYIRRLLETNGTPYYYHREYLVYDPTRPVVEAELEVTSLNQLFNGGCNALLKYGEISIEAAILSEEESRILKAEIPTAAFCFQHVFFDFEDRPTSWGWFLGRADNLHFSTQVGLIMNSGEEI